MSERMSDAESESDEKGFLDRLSKWIGDLAKIRAAAKDGLWIVAAIMASGTAGHFTNTWTQPAQGWLVTIIAVLSISLAYTTVRVNSYRKAHKRTSQSFRHIHALCHHLRDTVSQRREKI